MTHSPADPEAVRQLHDLFAEDELSEKDSEAETDELVLDADSREAISLVGLDAMSPEARDLLLRLTDYSENLEPGARENLVSAAERGMQWRRDNTSALPILLFAHRRESHLTTEEMSARLNVAAKTLADIESGAVSVRSLTPKAVAEWIHLLRVDPKDAETALHRGLERRRPSARAAGSRQPLAQPETDDGFIQEVVAQLNELGPTQ